MPRASGPGRLRQSRRQITSAAFTDLLVAHFGARLIGLYDEREAFQNDAETVPSTTEAHTVRRIRNQSPTPTLGSLRMATGTTGDHQRSTGIDGFVAYGLHTVAHDGLYRRMMTTNVMPTGDVAAISVARAGVTSYVSVPGMFVADPDIWTLCDTFFSDHDSDVGQRFTSQQWSWNGASYDKFTHIGPDGNPQWGDTASGRKLRFGFYGAGYSWTRSRQCWVIDGERLTEGVRMPVLVDNTEGAADTGGASHTPPTEENLRLGFADNWSAWLTIMYITGQLTADDVTALRTILPQKYPSLTFPGA